MDTEVTRQPAAGGARRALATRDAHWARALARWLARLGARPNPVSVAGVAITLAAAVALTMAPQVRAPVRVALLVAAAAGIQLRLLCNLLDGMLAVEHDLKSKTGEIFNEVPDRIADVVILVAAGYSVRHAAYGVALGWGAALLALFTAYVRVFAGSLGLRQQFIGPMAKQHRMFILTIATVLSAAEAWWGLPPRAMRAGLVVIIVGSGLTVVLRIHRIVRDIETR